MMKNASIQSTHVSVNTTLAMLADLICRQVKDACADERMNSGKIMEIHETARAIIRIMDEAWRLQRKNVTSDRYIKASVSIPIERAKEYEVDPNEIDTEASAKQDIGKFLVVNDEKGMSIIIGNDGASVRLTRIEAIALAEMLMEQARLSTGK